MVGRRAVYQLPGIWPVNLRRTNMIWFKNNPQRFAVEKKLLARFHPGVKIIIKDGQMSVFKKFVTYKNSYLIEAKYSARHPYSPMEVFIREPYLKKTPPHRYAKGQLCLHGTSDIGAETTAKVYLDWTEQWIRIYECWLEGKPWPNTNRGKSRSNRKR